MHCDYIDYYRGDDLLKFIEAKPFNFSSIKDISNSQLNQHYILYTRYISATNKATVELSNNLTYENCNMNFSNLWCAIVTRSFNLDAVKLHELYFENMTGLNNKMHGKIDDVITQTFGSYDNFKEKFKCIGLTMRGWVVFCYDSFTNDYYIYGQDSHNTEIIMNTYPIIVMDVYEHSYMIDFGIDKGAYIEAFFRNLDFKVVNNRLWN